MKEHIKTWRRNGFRLDLWDLYRRDELGKHVLGYRFRDRGVTIFEGEDFACSPQYAIDSLSAVYALLSFLTLQPGDTDEEYFAHYTEAQRVWRDSDRCSDLQVEVAGLEERNDRRIRS